MTIIVDDREKKPWSFDSEKFVIKTKRLETGDYTIKGMEDFLVVEKKSGLPEFLTDISGTYRARFMKALTRMMKFEHRYIIIEDDLKNAAKTIMNCPKTRLTVSSIYYWVNTILIEYKIPILFIGKRSSVKRRILENFFLQLGTLR